MIDLTDSDVWGPKAWYLIHHITRRLVKDNPTGQLKSLVLEAVDSFFFSLTVLMPCAVCQENYKQKLIEDGYQNHLDSWKALDEWSHQLHNRVNKMLNKKEMPQSEYLKMYKKVDKQKLQAFVKILEDLYVEKNMALSEIQNMKILLDSLVVLYPTKKLNVRNIEKEREKVRDIYNYQGLNNFLRKYL